MLLIAFIQEYNVFYLNLFKAFKFALKVIDMNRPALNLQLGLGTNYDDVLF